MRVNNLSEFELVKPSTRRGGVYQSVIMSLIVSVLVIVTYLSMVPGKLEMKGIDWKTTEMSAHTSPRSSSNVENSPREVTHVF